MAGRSHGPQFDRSLRAILIVEEGQSNRVRMFTITCRNQVDIHLIAISIELELDSMPMGFHDLATVGTRSF